MAHDLQTPAAPGLSEDQARGLALACSSAVFIGSSFIIKKKGLRVAGASGTRAGALQSHVAKSSSLFHGRVHSNIVYITALLVQLSALAPQPVKALREESHLVTAVRSCVALLLADR